ncbi:thiol-disulfide isomerase [archaeon CG10_big_fil_rev_8_21_14_0_10_43_11]|nr:MAG: thiol-disulfide isomerase [archaeon CG10_big_fil_rev_8_21_14_0_10_43_11]
MKSRHVWLTLALIIIVGLILYLQGQNASQGVLGTISDAYWSTQNVEAPELAGISGYINTDENFTLASVRGNVVIVDFWTYSCINCIRTIPHLTSWYEKYADAGLVIVGVHTPEFEFEKEYDNVAQSVADFGIEYPVVQDNDYLTWRAYNNRFWPHKFIIDANGVIRDDVIGEGQYEKTEQTIRALLEEAGASLEDVGDIMPDLTPTTPNTPELYLGYAYAIPRGQNIGNSGGLQLGEIVTYTLPSSIGSHRVYLSGAWQSTNEYVIAKSNESVMLLDYYAKNANIVADSNNGAKRVRVMLNGADINESYAGDDVRFDESGAYITIDKPRLYNVVAGEYANHLLQLVFEENVSANAFTFG